MIGAFPPVLAATSLMPSEGGANMAVSLALAGLAFMVSMVVGRPYITFLRHKRIGKRIRMDLDQHMGKSGTPTMGGVMIVAIVVLLMLIFNVWGRLSMLLPIGVLVATSVLGGVDDMLTIVGVEKPGKEEGMSGKVKMIWLGLISVLSAFILHLPDPYGLGLTHMSIPWLGRFDIGWMYIPIAAFVILSMANAVNLTDGLDTLAPGTSAVAFVAFGVIAYLQGQLGVVTFCFIMVGALLGFLWFNANPAQVFMGDAGSLSLGASLAVAAFMTGQWLLLAIVGGVFVAETVSVMIQTTWFKYTRKKTGEGKRIFKMTPLHHHFERSGWSETQVALRFWIVGMMLGILGVALALV